MSRIGSLKGPDPLVLRAGNKYENLFNTTGLVPYSLYSMVSINEVQDEIIQEFALFDDWLDKYDYLIELSNDLPVIDPQFKTSQHLIEGCQSKVWLFGKLDGTKIHFTADSDAIITKGIIALLIRVLSGREPTEIIGADLYFIDRIGLKENLSPTRSNGLLAMLKQMKLYAIAYQAKLNQPH